jgi:cell division protein ZapB
MPRSVDRAGIPAAPSWRTDGLQTPSRRAQIFENHVLTRLTAEEAATIFQSMAKKTPKAHYEQELRQLESRLDELLVASTRLQEENRSLRAQQDSVLAERAQLLQRNEQARTRVEAMISRLKGMENAP